MLGGVQVQLAWRPPESVTTNATLATCAWLIFVTTALTSEKVPRGAKGWMTTVALTRLVATMLLRPEPRSNAPTTICFGGPARVARILHVGTCAGVVSWLSRIE